MTVTKKSLKNLKPVKTKAEARKRGRIGGLSRSIKKSEGAKLRYMKNRLKLGTQDMREIGEAVTNSQYMATQIYAFIHKQLLDAAGMSRKERMDLTRVMMDCHKTIHGEKQNIELSGHTTGEVRVAHLIKVVKDEMNKNRGE